jgi:RNA polymerase sigma-70 factor (ECF subfamily)
MLNNSSFADLLARVRAGDQAAAALVVEEYARRLAALARRNLDPRILRKEDPEDVLQSVFKSFFRRVVQGQFRLGSRDELWALLVRLTHHKCGHRADYHRAARRDIRREVQVPLPVGSSGVEEDVPGRDPTPAEAAMLMETINGLLGALKPYQQQIVRHCLEGERRPHVAKCVGVTQRTVYRTLKDVRKLLEHWCRNGEDHCPRK